MSYRNQSIDLLCKSMDWFLYDIGLRREIINFKIAIAHKIVEYATDLVSYAAKLLSRV